MAKPSVSIPTRMQKFKMHKVKRGGKEGGKH